MSGRTLCLTIIALMCIGMPLFAGCTSPVVSPVSTPTPTTPAAVIPNPSALYCESRGYTYQIVTNPDGSQAGNCVFSSGRACDGWAYFRGECTEATAAAPGTGMTNPSATYCVTKGNTYRITTNADGSQSGICVFPSGKQCDGWVYYRGECNETSAAAPGTAPANPSATYCISKGYNYQILTNPDDSQSGICVFPSGKQCDGWAYYRGECNETSVASSLGTGIANPSATYCVSKGYTYQIVTNPDGNQSGNCVFPSGKSCEGWAYFRRECTEATSK